jgi:cell division protein FtsB
MGCSDLFGQAIRLPNSCNQRMISNMDQKQNPNSSPHRLLRNRLLIAAGIIIGLLIFGELWRRISQASELRGLENRVGAQVTQLSHESNQLATKIAGAQSDEAVAEWAHSQSKMVQPGEVLVMPLTPAPKASPTPSVQSTPPSLPNWRVWWEWIWGTG